MAFDQQQTRLEASKSSTTMTALRCYIRAIGNGALVLLKQLKSLLCLLYCCGGLEMNSFLDSSFSFSSIDDTFTLGPHSLAALDRDWKASFFGQHRRFIRGLIVNRRMIVGGYHLYCDGIHA
jgi:hypothetical protein